MRARFLLSAVVALGCGRSSPAPEPVRPASDPIEPAAASASPETRALIAPSAAPAELPASSRAACPAVRPFMDLGDSKAEKRLTLPAPFASFNACDALLAIHPDYDPQTEASAKAGGRVRADKAFVFRTSGRALLAVTRYMGPDAEQSMMCGCCSAEARVALLEARGGRLALVADADQPIEHGGINDGISLAAAQLAIRQGEELLTFDAAHACGTSPGRHYLHAFRLQGSELRQVLRHRASASGMDVNANLVRVAATPTPRKGKGEFFDIVLSWTRAPCPFDDAAGDYVCKAPAPIGTEILRFDGRTYRLAGAPLRLELFD